MLFVGLYLVIGRQWAPGGLGTQVYVLRTNAGDAKTGTLAWGINVSSAKSIAFDIIKWWGET